MSKKVLSLVLSVLLIINVAGISISAAPAPDVKGTAFEEAATILTDMGIMSLKEDGTFGVAGDITVGEYMDAVLKLIGVDASNATPGTRFSDVPATHTYAKQVEMACQMNIYKGVSADKFGVDDKLTVGVAIQAVLNAVGYGEYAKVKGGYPFGYAVVASEKDILKNVPSESTVVTRGLAADMIYNALFLNVMIPTTENGSVTYREDTSKTILSSVFDAYVAEGIVTSNQFMTLPAGKGMPAGNIAITQGKYCDNYATGNIDANKYLGYNVTAIYTTNKGFRSLLAICADSNKNKVETFDARDITKLTANEVVYFPETANKETEYTLEAYAPVLDNYKLAQTSDGINFKVPDYGEVTLIDNNNDGNYDVVFIDSYSVMVINSIDKINTTLYGKYTYDSSVSNELDQYAVSSVDLGKFDKYVIKDPTGKVVKLGDVKKTDIATVKIYPDEKLVEVNLTRTMETATVDELTQLGDGKYPNQVKFKSGEKEYKVAASYYKAKGTSEIQLGGKYDVYLDAKGEIAYMVQKVDDTLQYGYLLKGMISKEGIDHTLEVKIYTVNGEFITAKSGEKLIYSGTGSVNGMTKSYSQQKLPYETVHELLYANNGTGFNDEYNKGLAGYSTDAYVGAMAIRYQISSDNVLQTIETAYSDLVDGFRKAGSIGSGSTRYKSRSKLIGGSIMMGEATKCMDVANPKESDKESSYSNKLTITNESYYTYLYAYTSTLDSPAAQFIIHQTGAVTGEIDENDPAYVFVKYVESYNPETQKTGKSIVVFDNGEFVTYPVDQTSTDLDADGYFMAVQHKKTSTDAEVKRTLLPGDVVRFVFNGDDEVMTGSEILFTGGGAKDNATNGTNLVEGVVTWYGKVFRRLGNGGYFSTDGGKTRAASIFNFDTAKSVVIVDTNPNETRDSRKYSVGSVDDIKTVYDVGQENASRASDVFAFIREGAFMSIVIYKDSSKN